MIEQKRESYIEYYRAIWRKKSLVTLCKLCNQNATQGCFSFAMERFVFKHWSASLMLTRQYLDENSQNSLQIFLLFVAGVGVGI